MIHAYGLAHELIYWTPATEQTKATEQKKNT